MNYKLIPPPDLDIDIRGSINVCKWFLKAISGHVYILRVYDDEGQYVSDWSITHDGASAQFVKELVESYPIIIDTIFSKGFFKDINQDEILFQDMAASAAAELAQLLMSHPKVFESLRNNRIFMVSYVPFVRWAALTVLQGKLQHTNFILADTTETVLVVMLKLLYLSGNQLLWNELRQAVLASLKHRPKFSILYYQVSTIDYAIEFDVSMGMLTNTQHEIFAMEVANIMNSVSSEFSPVCLSAALSKAEQSTMHSTLNALLQLRSYHA